MSKGMMNVASRVSALAAQNGYVPRVSAFAAPTPVGAHPRRVALVARRNARNSPLGRFLFAKLFLLGLHGQKKKRE